MNADLAIGIGALGFIIGPLWVLILIVGETGKNSKPSHTIGGTTIWTDD